MGVRHHDPRARVAGLFAAGILIGCEATSAAGTGGALDATSNAASTSAASSTSNGASSGTSASSSTSSGASVVSCGGPKAIACPDGSFCNWLTDLCNGDDAFGACKPQPTTCEPADAPVCACNGTTYPNRCEAQKAGWDVSNVAACPAPEGTFGCGPMFCAEDHYCERTPRSSPNGADDFACVPLPAPCGPTPTCDCLDQEPCGSTCQTNFTGHLVVTCSP